MPELPEVETIKRGLLKLVVGKKLKKTTILCAKSFIGEPEKILNAKVEKLRRFGKALILDFDNGNSAMVHLRMTGQLIFDADDEDDSSGLNERFAVDGSFVADGRFAAGHPSENFVDKLPNRQTRVILEFENGTLYFNDQRKFGFIKVLETNEVKDDAFIRKLAKEPWEMSAEEFYEKLQKHKNSPIKAVMLDQTIVCGLGNIYADESLFKSKIHPETRAGDLSKKQAEILLKNAAEVMSIAIESGGSTMKDYVKADGTRGDYLDKFAQVFNRTGQPCLNCGTEIIKIRVAGRGTHICPKCQKLATRSEK